MICLNMMDFHMHGYLYIYMCVCVCMDGYYNGVYVIHIARISVYMLTHAYIHTYNIFT